MNGSAIYQACARCTAKWFGSASVDLCPRCGSTTLPPVQATPPFRVHDVQRQSVATLLASVPADHRVASFAEALGHNPPWSNNIVRTLQQQIGSEFPQSVASDWWPSVPLVLQQPRRRSTQQLLESMSRGPSQCQLHTFFQHLRQRCRDNRVKIVHRVCRFVIRLLRHGAGFKSVSIDPEGWVAIEDLLQRINRRALEFELWRDWTIHDLQRQCDLHGGRRLQISDGLDFIRARYGHTIPDICAGQHRLPPPVLYHGTSQELAGQILQQGLQRRERNLVHLTSSFDYAAWIARNHESPEVLQVNTDTATSAGVPFWMCNDHVWQCTDLPATVMQFVRTDASSQNQKGRS